MKLVIPLFILIASPAFAQTETQDFDAASIESFELEGSSGDTVVRKGDAKNIKIIAKKKKFDKECSLEMKKTSTKVIVKVDQPFRKTCEVDFDITLPENLNMSLSSGSGDFDISGTKGDIVYRVGSGDVKIKADVKRIDGRSGSGRLDAKGNLNDIKLLNGSGETKITYTKTPVAGMIEIKAGSGDSVITLPKETKLISDSTIGAGKFFNEFGDSKDAKFQINFKAGAGNLKILKATN
jgi:hypothetical protein